MQEETQASVKSWDPGKDGVSRKTSQSTSPNEAENPHTVGTEHELLGLTV